MLYAQEKQMITRFRPQSKKAFSQCTRHLSWLVKLPYQRTMEMLARIYGYADYHELQKDLSKTEKLAGPYDDGRVDGVISSERQSDYLPDVSGRRDRVLRFVAEYKGVAIENLSSRDREAVNIGLFKFPPRHRKDFQLIRDRVNALSDIK
jgi:hypothetical protein